MLQSVPSGIAGCSSAGALHARNVGVAAMLTPPACGVLQPKQAHSPTATHFSPSIEKQATTLGVSQPACLHLARSDPSAVFSAGTQVKRRWGVGVGWGGVGWGQRPGDARQPACQMQAGRQAGRLLQAGRQAGRQAGS